MALNKRGEMNNQQKQQKQQQQQQQMIQAKRETREKHHTAGVDSNEQKKDKLSRSYL